MEHSAACGCAAPTEEQQIRSCEAGDLSRAGPGQHQRPRRAGPNTKHRAEAGPSAEHRDKAGPGAEHRDEAGPSAEHRDEAGLGAQRQHEAGPETQLVAC